ncbi:hypothetical protein D3C86_1718370 [compost metagenome]
MGRFQQPNFHGLKQVIMAIVICFGIFRRLNVPLLFPIPESGCRYIRSSRHFPYGFPVTVPVFFLFDLYKQPFSFIQHFAILMCGSLSIVEQPERFPKLFSLKQRKDRRGNFHPEPWRHGNDAFKISSMLEGIFSISIGSSPDRRYESPSFIVS